MAIQMMSYRRKSLNPDSEGGRQLVLVESLLQKNTDFKTTILRFGGLIGDDRNWPFCWT
jgi:hypothetical protein